LTDQPSRPAALRFRNPIDTLIFRPSAWPDVFKCGNQNYPVTLIDFAYSECSSLPQFAGNAIHFFT
jgi:hypothetical protein